KYANTLHRLSIKHSSHAASVSAKPLLSDSQSSNTTPKAQAPSRTSLSPTSSSSALNHRELNPKYKPKTHSLGHKSFDATPKKSLKNSVYSVYSVVKSGILCIP